MPRHIHTSPYPPSSAICHKSRSDQKLGFLERREQSSNSSSFQYRLASKVQVEWAIAQDSGFAVQRLVQPLYLCYFNIMLLFIMFLICSSYMLDIVMIDDEFMHMFAKLLDQYQVSEVVNCRQNIVGSPPRGIPRMQIDQQRSARSRTRRQQRHTSQIGSAISMT